MANLDLQYMKYLVELILFQDVLEMQLIYHMHMQMQVMHQPIMLLKSKLHSIECNSIISQ
jgi:hypothetical protein